MKPAIQLREKLKRRELITGVLVIHNIWPDLVEVVRRAGMDYLIVDMEHGCPPANLVAEVCAIGRQTDFPVLIRPQANDYATLRLAIDLGPCGFLLACVESPTDLDGVRDAVFLPPRGRRRPGGPGNRWVSSYLHESWQREFEDHFLILPQIETRHGMQHAQAIAAHEITTALAVGPYDLSAELGVCGKFDDPHLRQALDKLRETARSTGKEMWVIGGDGPQMVRDGWRFLCVGEPTWILEAALRDQVEKARRALEG